MERVDELVAERGQEWLKGVAVVVELCSHTFFLYLVYRE